MDGSWFFQLLMLNSNLLKFQIPYVQGGYMVFPTFDDELKSDKIQNSLCLLGGGRVHGFFQLLIPRSNLLQSKIPYVESFAENFQCLCHKMGPSCSSRLQMVPHTLCVHGTITKDIKFINTCLV